MSDKREQIIESAMRMIRNGGYNAFSFREIADEVGVKSSSVHHYFRRKEDLATVVAGRYSEVFFGVLGPSAKPDRDAATVIEDYAEAFIDAFKSSGKACLCAILSHEAPAVPAPVTCEVAAFVDANVNWLCEAFRSATDGENLAAVEHQARLTYSALNGAMAVATLKQDISWLESVRDRLMEQVRAG